MQFNKFFVLVIGLLLLQANLFATEVFVNENPDGTVSFSDMPSMGAQTYQIEGVSNRYRYLVEKVIDGDTIKLSNGERVRLLGLNTPEIKSRFKDAQQGGEQAKLFLQDKLQDKQVYLEFDQQQQDRYQRLLAHCFLESGEHINLSLVEQGMASLTIIPPNLKYSDELIKAEQTAKAAQKGIWALEDYQIISSNQLASTGKTGWFRVRVQAESIKTTRKYVRLLAQNLELKIDKHYLDLFPDLSVYLGKQLVVQGWVSKLAQGKSMRIYHPSAIMIE